MHFYLHIAILIMEKLKESLFGFKFLPSCTGLFLGLLLTVKNHWSFIFSTYRSKIGFKFILY